MAIRRRLEAALAGLLMMAPIAASAAPVAPETTDASAIMAAVEDRAEGDRISGRLTMTLIDKSGRQRQRVVRSWTRQFDGGTRQLMIFEGPADVANTGLLSIDYDAGDRDDDQWLFLPSLHKSTRISSGEKSGSFMGTDLSYADMTRADPKHYAYTMVDANATVDGEPAWLIESRPTSARAKDETGYLKSHLWISKSKLVPLQVKAWVIKGKRLKYIKFEDVKQLGEAWVPHKITARTVDKDGKPESTTVLQFSELRHDDPAVTDELFTERRLEQGL